MQRLGSLIFPDSFYSWKGDGQAVVEGTFAILDERIASPINHVRVECYKAGDYCEVGQLDLIVPKEDS